MPDSTSQPGDHEPDNKRLTRRVFVASGVAAGAAVVWTSPFPFADSPIGQSASAQGTTGTTGTTGPTGTTTTPTTTTPKPPTTTTPKPPATGGTGPAVGRAALAIGTTHVLRARKAGYVVVTLRAKGPKPLSGTVKLDRLVGGKRRSVGRATFKLGVGQKKNIKIPLNLATRKVLAKQAKLGARFTAVAGGAPARRKQVSILAAKKKKK